MTSPIKSGDVFSAMMFLVTGQSFIIHTTSLTLAYGGAL